MRALLHNMTNPNNMTKPSQTARIMAVFAHPDDEAFSVAGTLSALAEAGHEVTLVCATRGEAGKITVPDMTVEDLGQQREQELREACAIMGIGQPIMLDYHDSGRFERTRHDDPKALLNVDPLDLETPIRALIAERQPHILITFDPHGGYAHVDHLQVQRATTAAFFSSGSLPYGGPQRLYFTVSPLAYAQHISMIDSERELKPELYGVSESTAAVRVNIQQQRKKKLAALAAHGTQMGANSLMGRLSDEQRQQFEESVLGEEWFALGGTRVPIAHYPLSDLLDGICTDNV